MYEWDESKRRRNLAKHKVDFELVHDFDMATADVRQDSRGKYGEARFIADGLIGDRLYILVFTMRASDIRVISLRKANTRERKRHGQTKKLY